VEDSSSRSREMQARRAMDDWVPHGLYVIFNMGEVGREGLGMMEGKNKFTIL